MPHARLPGGRRIELPFVLTNLTLYDLWLICFIARKSLSRWRPLKEPGPDRAPCDPGYWRSLVRGFFDLGDEFFFAGWGGVGDEEGGHRIGDDETFLE